MKAYVTYKFGTTVSTIYQILKENGIQFFDSLSNINYGASLQESIINAIKDCDFVVMVYTEDSGNLGFESGIAAALKKPIFSIISSQDDYPDFLIESMHVNASPEDYDKIDYNLQLFIKNIKPQKVKSPKLKDSKSIRPTRNWQNQYNHIQIKNEVAIEHLFKEIFTDLSINFVSQPSEKNINYRADFSIWSDGLSSVLGNPILVEIKNELTSRNFNSTVNQLKEGIEVANAKAAILFYDSSIQSIENRIDEISLPNLLIIKISDFIQSLDGQGFEKTIVEIRNRSVHKF